MEPEKTNNEPIVRLTNANIIAIVGLLLAMMSVWVIINQRVTALEIEMRAIEDRRVQDRVETKDALNDIRTTVKETQKKIEDIYFTQHK